MVWVPKAGAPATFNLVDAFIALVTGDATWGWLLDWLPYVSNDHFSTIDFCSQGPSPVLDLSVALGPSPPDRSPIEAAAKIVLAGIAVTSAARDRVFGAYCEIPSDPGGVTWSGVQCTSGDTHTFPGNWMAGGVSPWGDYDRIAVRTFSSDVGQPMGVWFGNVDNTVHSFLGAFGPTGSAVPYVSGPGVPAGQNYIWLTPVGSGALGPFTICIDFGKLGGSLPHTVLPQPQPAGVISPIRPVAPTLDGIASEVAQIELKLDNVIPMVASILAGSIDLGALPDAPADLPVNTPVAVGDAVGCVLTASGVPASRSLDFGDPQHIVKLGIVNLGTADAWYPSIWLTHTPMVIRPFPPGVKRVTITDLPPGVTVQVAFIRPTS